MLNPSNIKGKSFETEKNGYSQSDVNAFLTQVAADYSQALLANQENEAKIVKLVEKINEYREDEDAIKDALVSSQKEASRIISEAKAKAKDMIENAKSEQMKLAEQSAAECERIVRDHKEKCAQLIKDNTEITEKKIRAIRAAYEEEKDAYENLQAEVTYFKANLTDLYNKQIRLIMELPTMNEQELADYESSFDESYEEETEEYYDETPVEETAAPAVDETPAEQPQTSTVDKALNTGSFEPVIPKSNFNDLKFGKNN